MSSNQDSKQKELVIPMTGIQVMRDLSLDARKVLSLAYEGVLMPYIPKRLTKQYFEFCLASRYDEPESHLSRLGYRKSDVEGFKLMHKDFWEELRKETLNGIGKDDKQTEESSQLAPEGEHLFPSRDSAHKKLETTTVKKSDNFFTRGEDKHWRVGFNGKERIIDPLDGIQYLAILLEKPGTAISCIDLYQIGSGKMPTNIMSEGTAIGEGLNIGSSQQPVSSPKAKAEYMTTYLTLENELLKNDDLPDNERTPEHEIEKKEIEEEMAAIRPYLEERAFSDPNDKRAQINLGRRLNVAYTTIQKAGMKELAKHLKSHIKPDGAFGLSYTGTLTWNIVM